MSASDPPRRIAPPLPQLAARLRESSRKMTGPRQAILGLLRRRAQPLTIKGIFEELDDGTCDLATVYRAMHLLESIGLVQRVDFGDGAARFKLVPAGGGGHHHYLVCTRCAAVVEVEECFSTDLEQRIAAENGFKAVTHRLEFFGVCPRCQ